MTAIERIRAEYEAAVAVELRRSTPQRRRAVLAALRRYGSVEAIPEAVWAEIGGRVRGQLVPLSRSMAAEAYADAVRGAAEDQEAAARRRRILLLLLLLWWLLSFGEDGDDRPPQLERVAADRARAAGDRLAKSMGEDVADATKRRAARAIEGGATPEEAASVATDPDANEPVVGTRTTDGASDARSQALEDLEAATGQTGRLIWVTERGADGRPDERVCPICRPLDGTDQSVWLPAVGRRPPAHVNCRCDVRVSLA